MLVASDDMSVSDGDEDAGGEEAYTQAAEAKPKSSDQTMEEMGLPVGQINGILARLKEAEDEYKKTGDEDMLPIIADIKAELEAMGISVVATDPNEKPMTGIGVTEEAIKAAEKKAEKKQEKEEAKRKLKEEKANKEKAKNKAKAAPASEGSPQSKPQSKLMKKLSNPIVIGCAALMLVSAGLLAYSLLSGGDGEKKSD